MPASTRLKPRRAASWSLPILIPLLLPLLLVAATLLPSLPRPAAAISARVAFEARDAALKNGACYTAAAYTNASGTLGWGQSYCLMAYSALYRTTHDPKWLDKLADQSLATLAKTDAALGLKDFAGKSGPCWQATKYSASKKPYCWVVHSGMLTYPMAELALYVAADPALKTRKIKLKGAAHGKTLGAVADQLRAAVAKTIAWHEHQWRNGKAGDGGYIFDPKATFLPYAGKIMPLNQHNAMGRTLLAMYQLTGQSSYLNKAIRMAKRQAMAMQASGPALVWNYWGDAYKSPGEDISHAAINVDFIRQTYDAGVVFNALTMVGLGATFFHKVYGFDGGISGYVGAYTSAGKYDAQLGRWLRMTPWQPSLYTAARYSLDAVKSTNGSMLYSLALLAEFEPWVVPHSFYVVDWKDLGDHRQATAANANVLLRSPAVKERAMAPITYAALHPVTVQQWDGTSYHDVARWPATPRSIIYSETTLRIASSSSDLASPDW